MYEMLEGLEMALEKHDPNLVKSPLDVYDSKMYLFSRGLTEQVKKLLDLLNTEKPTDLESAYFDAIEGVKGLQANYKSVGWEAPSIVFEANALNNLVIAIEGNRQFTCIMETLSKISTRFPLFVQKVDQVEVFVKLYNALNQDILALEKVLPKATIEVKRNVFKPCANTEVKRLVKEADFANELLKARNNVVKLKSEASFARLKKRYIFTLEPGQKLMSKTRQLREEAEVLLSIGDLIAQIFDPGLREGDGYIEKLRNHFAKLPESSKKSFMDVEDIFYRRWKLLSDHYPGICKKSTPNYIWLWCKRATCGRGAFLWFRVIRETWGRK